MAHVVFAPADARFGDFVADHWLASLRDNVDLRGIDVAILDYGMTDRQRDRLAALGAICHRCVRDGHVTNIRYRDIARVLRGGRYDQVLSADGGDIIFQADFREALEHDKDRFRVVCHQLEVPFNEVIVDWSDFSPEMARTVAAYLRDKPTINGGVVFGPAPGFIDLWERMQQVVSSFVQFGIDQVLLNYLLHQDGFVRLDFKYNYSIICRASEYRVRNGVFYDAAGAKIPIVHNCGIYEPTRPIAKFGYGKGRNRPRVLVPWMLRTAYKTFNLFRPATLARRKQCGGEAPPRDARTTSRQPGAAADATALGRLPS